MSLARNLQKGLAEVLRKLRKGHGWTRRELAQRSGLSERFLAELEGGAGNPSLLSLADLATALGVPPARLVADAEAASPVARSVVALLGLRGAGKSTVGEALARRLELPFVELDERIEEAVGMSLSEIFQIHGEAFYRRAERSALDRVLAQPAGCVLATGGGVVTAPDTFALLRERAHTVWLRARPEDHWERVLAQGDTRPMAEDDRAFQSLCEILAEREPLYAGAEVTIDTSGRQIDSIVDETVARLGWTRVRA
jgi:XRE family aerobic/anaerobic benzoate catabolism transcriptional regulator